VRDALLRVATTANASTWAAFAPDDRARALAVLDRLAGESPPFATLAVTSAEARLRDLVALAHLAIDAGEGDVERGVEPIVPRPRTSDAMHDAWTRSRGAAYPTYAPPLS
jgi:hypothetical protein